MADIYALTNGTWEATATWSSGTVPVTGDRVLIPAGITVTLNSAQITGDDLTTSITIDSIVTTHSITILGTLSYSRTVSASLTAYGNIYVGNGGLLDIGSTASPIPVGILAALYINDSATLTTGKYGLFVDNGGNLYATGYTKQRITTLTASTASAATSFSVANASNWQVGDQIYFCADGVGSSFEYDILTIATVSGNVITTTTGSGYAHNTPCPVANITSSSLITSFNYAYPGYVECVAGNASAASTYQLGYNTVRDLDSAYPYDGMYFNMTAQYTANYTPNPFTPINSSAFVGINANATFGTVNCNIGGYTATPLTFNDCCFIGADGTSTAAGLLDVAGNVTCNGCLSSASTAIRSQGQLPLTYNNGWANSLSVTPVLATSRHMQFNSTIFLGPGVGALQQTTAPGASGASFNYCDFNSTFARTAGTALVALQSVGEDLTISFVNCLNTLSHISGPQATITSSSEMSFINEGGLLTAQYDYYQYGSITRNNTVTLNSQSSAQLTLPVANVPFSPAEPYPIAAGQTLTFVGSIQYDANYYNSGTGFVAPSITLSGTINGTVLSPASYSAPSASAGVWNSFTLSITNTTSIAGTIDITASVEAPVTTGNVYFDGIDYGRFVTFTRHYGYTFNEGVAAQTVNPYTVASYATALAYTGIAITWGTTSSVSITGSTTFQEVYDYSQAEAISNLFSSVPFVGLGAADAVQLSLLGNFSIASGVTLNGSGSIATNAFTLSGYIGVDPFSYTSGGTFSQGATIPSFSGGELTLSTLDTYDIDASGLIINFNPTAAGSFNLGGGSFGGILDLRNASAFAITVYLPSGVSYITSNNTGGAITVSLPAIFQSITIDNLIANSQVWLYDTTAGVQLANVNVGAATTYTWTDTVAAAANRVIHARIANVQAATAYIFIDSNIGTCGTTTTTAALTYAAQQVLDSTYNLNAVTGSAVAGMVASSTELSITVATATWAQIYAYMAYWISTATGIAQQTVNMFSTDTAHYTITDGYKIKNTSSPSAALEISNGNCTSTTGVPLDILDTTGGTIFINSSIVVAYAVGSGLTSAQAAQLTAIDTNLGTPSTTIAQELSQVLTTAQFIGLS